MVVPVKGRTLAGLGDCQYDDATGEWTGCTSLDFPTGANAPPDSAFALSDPVFENAGITTATGPGVTVISSSVDANGNVYMALSNGKYMYVDPSGKVLAGVGAPSGTGGTITAAQANAWPSIINTLAQAGVKLGTVAMLQPGQTLLANGTIVGSGQRLVSPSGSVNASFASVISNPMFLVAAGGILLLALVGGRR